MNLHLIKKGHAWFTTVPIKPLQFIWLTLFFFLACAMLIFVNPSSFSCSRNSQVTFVENPQLKIISFQNYDHRYIIHTWLDKVFNGTHVNWTCHSLKWRVTWYYVYTLETLVQSLLKKWYKKSLFFLRQQDFFIRVIFYSFNGNIS